MLIHLDKSLALEILVCLFVEHISFTVLKLLDLVLLGSLWFGTFDLLPHYKH